MDTKPLSPSERKRITEPQINKFAEAFAAALRKVNPFSDEAQLLIEESWDEVNDRVIDASVDALNQILAKKFNTITVRVKVRRGLTAVQVLGATRRVQYITPAVIGTIPLVDGEGEEDVDFVFFRIGRRLGEGEDGEIEKERAKRGLVRDFAAQAQFNADNSSFSLDHPNGDSWQDTDEKWCYASFRQRAGRVAGVSVHYRDGDWRPGDWHGGAVPRI